jgi:signal transduction histidine kinase
VRDGAGAVTGIASIQRDISAQQLLEAQLREAQKMEAIGRLAGGVAHDFNNLLTAILASAELGLADPALPESGELRADLAEIRSAAMRAAELTKQLLAFSRRQELQPQRLDVNEVIANAERLLRRAVGDGAETRITLGDEVPPVVADRGQLEQVLLNLALNARDAMQERTHGALLTIETSGVTVGRASGGTAPAGVALTPGRWAVIVVRDTGIGMDAAVAARVFEPFFTTKEVGKGTGLGLAMVYGIVTQSGGHITAEGVPGVGSTFTIYLPAAPAAPERTPTLRDRPPTP